MQRSDENTRAQSFGTVFDEDTLVTQAFVQDQFEIGRFTRGSRSATSITKPSAASSPGTPNSAPRSAAARASRCQRRQRLPRSRQHRPFRLRRQSGPRSGSLGAGRDLRAPEVRRRQQLSLSAFDNHIDDLIDYVIVDFNTFEGQNQNVERARIKGVELGYQYTAKPGARAPSSRCRIRVTKPPTNACCAARANRWCSRSIATWARSTWAWTSPRSAIARTSGFPTNVTLDSYALVNATLRYRVNGALTLQGRLENLLDEDYMLAQGYRTEGRAYTVGVRYSFD